MSKPNRKHDRSITHDATCMRCRRAGIALRWCRLTGMSLLLCADCSKTMLATSPVNKNRRPPAGPTMTDAEMQFETFRERAFERLGADEPQCACCLETDECCLEAHHLEGEDFGETLINVCRNCHRKLSRAQRGHPAKFGEPPMTLETIAHLLLGIADYFRLIAAKLADAGHYLLELAREQSAKRKSRAAHA